MRSRGLVTRATVLVLAVAVVYLLVAPGAWCFGGPVGPVSAAVAGLCCLAGAMLALISGEPFRTTERALHGMLLGMAFRMGIPLGVGLAVYLHGGALVQAGFIYYLLVFFEITLLVEVYLSLPPLQRRERNESGARKTAL
ncbi:MAG: hypothetical protein JW888_10680 [Pirellulales bacterium]|nr:hypothetical protein [Pirellulales bacterium]